MVMNKNRIIFLWGVSSLISQTPGAGTEVKAEALIEANRQLKQMTEALQAMKALNQQLLEKQQKSLEQLDTLQKQSDQIRFIGRRI